MEAKDKEKEKAERKAALSAKREVIIRAGAPLYTRITVISALFGFPPYARGPI